MVDRRIGAHCFVFGVYLAAMTVGLVAVNCWVYAALYGAMLATLVWLTHRYATTADARSAVLAYAFFPVAMELASNPATLDSVAFQAPIGVVFVPAIVRLSMVVSEIFVERFSKLESPMNSDAPLARDNVPAKMPTPMLTRFNFICPFDRPFSLLLLFSRNAQKFPSDLIWSRWEAI